MATAEKFLPNLPEDQRTLKALLRAAARRARPRAAARGRASSGPKQQGKRADDLYLQNLRLQLELERYKKWYYGPRADRLKSSGELAQALLDFGEELEQKPVHPEDVPPRRASRRAELRRVKRRKGRRALANFENLPVTTQVYELSAEERACPCCGGGAPRDRRGGELADRVPARALRAHPACAQEVCLRAVRSVPGKSRRCRWRRGRNRPSSKGLAGPGLLAYIVTSKFADYLPLYRLEDIFARQGFEISRATQSVWCGDVADLVEPLVPADGRAGAAVACGGHRRHRPAHAEPGQDAAGADVGVRGRRRDIPTTCSTSPCDRGRDGPQEFLKDLHGGPAGRRLRRLQRRGGGQRHHARRMLVACATKGSSRPRKRRRRSPARSSPCCARCLRWNSRPRNFPSPSV